MSPLALMLLLAVMLPVMFKLSLNEIVSPASPADSTVVIEKPINLGAGDKLESQASADNDIDVFASILEMT